MVNESILMVRQSPQRSKYDLSKALEFIFKKPFSNQAIKKKSASPEDARPKRSQT